MGAGETVTATGLREHLDVRSRAENFPVAMRVLPRAVRERLLALYRYARYVDDVGDESEGDREVALHALAADVRRLYDGRRPEHEVVAGIAPLVTERAVPIHPWLRLVEANLQDQVVARYPTFEDLLGYCALSADPVGEIVLHLFDQAGADRVELSNRVCTGLQLLEHWQDVAEDRRAGRVYLPQADMAAFGVTEDMLDADRATPELVDLVAYETDRALAYIDSGSVLVATLHGWARVAVSGYVAGGRAAAAGLRRAGHDPLAGVPTPATRQVAAQWLAAAVRRPG